jgi:hypothetical protein
MLCLMMNYFEGCAVRSEAERHPDRFFEYKTSKKYLVLKQPFGYYEENGFFSERSLGKIKDKYNCKIIFMVRHPLDVGVSIHKSNPGIYWVPLNIIIRNCEAYLRNLSDPQVLFVRYEDLVAETKTEMERISEFIGCQYTDGFWQFYKHPHAGLPKNMSLDRPREISSESIGNWREDKHINRVKELLTPELREYINKLGYTI